jgi:hypothetical protein
LAAIPATVIAMNAGSLLASIVAGIITGGVAGYLSSVYAAGPVARRQENARRRMQAQQQLTDTVSAYLGRLSIGRPGQRGPQSIYADSYADLVGREELALTVTRLLPDLPRRSQERIRTTLQALVGNQALSLAGQRATVPYDALPDAETEAKRREVTERHLRMDYHDGIGCKIETQHLCERDHYPPARIDHGEIGVLWLTCSHPHGQYHGQAYETATRLLRQILTEADGGHRAL